MFKSYTKIKHRKNLHYTSYISFFFYFSLLLSYVVYVVLYGICNSILNILSPEEEYKTQIVINVLFFSSAIVLLTYYKDILFALFYIIFIIGHMITDIKKTELYTCLVLMILTLSSIGFTFYKHRYNALGFCNSEEISEILMHHDFQRSTNRASTEII